MKKWIAITALVLLAGCGKAKDETVDEAVNQAALASASQADKAELAKLEDAYHNQKPPYDKVPEPPVVIACFQDTDGTCDATRLQILREWPEAWSGDYEAQRNVAYVLSHPTAGVMPNPAQGCAWRMVILASGGPDIEPIDTSNYDSECSKLSATDLVVAKASAGAKFEKIYGKPLPEFPAL